MIAEILNQKLLPTHFYAGIGSRDTPSHIGAIMTKIAEKLEKEGFVLRSGGAKGADTYFEQGVKSVKNKEIFYAKDSDVLVEEIACHFHPAKHKLKDFNPFVLRLLARNTYQILGRRLNSLSGFVICWTPDGCIAHKDRVKKTGGTGQAISIASHFKVPIFNLARQEHLNLFNQYLDGSITLNEILEKETK